VASSVAIRYDMPIAIVCAQKLSGSQLSLMHLTKKTKNDEYKNWKPKTDEHRKSETGHRILERQSGRNLLRSFRSTSMVPDFRERYWQSIVY